MNFTMLKLLETQVMENPRKYIIGLKVNNGNKCIQLRIHTKNAREAVKLSD